MAAWFHLPWPWPVVSPTVLFRTAFENAELKLVCEIAGYISAEVTCELGVQRISTCPIMTNSPSFVFVGASFEFPSKLLVTMNDGVVASLEAKDAPLDRYEIPPQIEPDPKNYRDFQAENATAIRSRDQREVGKAVEAGRVRGDAHYIFEQLNNELNQVWDLIQLIDNGYLYHIAGLAARLRLLIARGVPLPLLQLAAAQIDAPLIAYTISQPEKASMHDIVPEAKSWLSFDIDGEPRSVYRNPIDVDVWLDFPAVRVNSKTYSQRHLIQAIGDTAGAHIDRDIDPLVAMLRKTRSTAVGGAEYDMLADYVRHVSLVVLALGKDILAANSHSSAGEKTSQ